jgi:anti-sigma factor RsiW
MLSQNVHPSDQELILAADGELQARRAAQVRAHLAACWDCRARVAEIEGTIADFARAYRQTLDPNLPPIDGPRALLRAQLAELEAKSHISTWWRFFHFSSTTRAAVYIFVTFFLAAMGSKLLVQRSTLREENTALFAVERGAVPDRNLTPGATRSVTISDVCSMAHKEVVRAVPTPLRQEIFQQYGIVAARADDYEIDYLIAPGLGGAEDIHNLWPEPCTSPTWNARVKDALEEHLHQMVCAGKLDLSTTQQDIATDWIAAYKKYFHTDRPIFQSSDRIRFLGVSFAPFALLGNNTFQLKILHR